jgi:DNA repair protein RAD50
LVNSSPGRYITTGDAPPGSGNGRSFVHDPKMAGEVRVVGTVKLRFRGINGKSYLISRSVEATQKAKNISIKTLDGTFKDIANNSALSMKCADINSHVLDNMGLTKPILNYVIFCHQEDSNWPLDEGGKVKDKFDEIFASAKYKDCLKRIKDVRAAQTIEKNKAQVAISYLKEDKKEAKEKRKELREKKEEKEALDNEDKDIEERLKPIKEKLKELQDTQTNLGGVEGKRDVAAANLKRTQQDVADLEKDLKDFKMGKDKTDDEVEEMGSKMEKELRGKNREIAAKIEELKRLEESVKELQSKKNNLAAALGELTTKKKQFDEKKETFSQKVATFGPQFGLDRFDENVADSEEDMDKVLAGVDKAVGNANKKVDKQEQEWSGKIDEQTSKIGEIQQKGAILKEKKRAAVDGLTKTKRDIAGVKSELRVTEGATETLNEIQKKCEDAQAELSRCKGGVDLNDLRNAIAVKKTEVKKLGARQDELREEKTLLEEHATAINAMDVKVEDREGKQAKLDKTWARCQRNLSDVGDLDRVKVPDVKERFKQRQESLQSSVKALEADKINFDNKKMAMMKEKKETQKDVTERDAKIRQFDDESAEVLSPEKDLEEELESTRVAVETARNDLQYKEANKHTFAEYIKTIDSMIKNSEKTACPTCSRAFKDADEAEELKRDLQSEIDRIPNKVVSIRDGIHQYFYNFSIFFISFF